MTITRKSKEVSAILAVSLILTALLFFVDESRYSFDFLSTPGLRLVLFFTITFSVIPLAIYGFVSDKNHYISFKWALFGFVPPLIVLCWLVLA
jgi:hypothetical protein